MGQPYVELEIDREKLQFEIPPETLRGEIPTGLGGRIGHVAKVSSTIVLERILSLGTLAMKAIDQFKQSPFRTPPKEITVEFGLNVDSEAGLLISKGSVGAHIQVSITWVIQEQ